MEEDNYQCMLLGKNEFLGETMNILEMLIESPTAETSDLLVINAILRLMGNLVASGDNMWADHLCDDPFNFLEVVKSALDKLKHPDLEQECLWITSNLICSTRAIAHNVFDQKLFACALKV